jgi:hypothetical protein
MSPPAAQLIDSANNVWTIANQKVVLNGIVRTETSSVILLLYAKGTLYQENASLNWYAWTNGDWSGAGEDPRVTYTTTMVAAHSGSCVDVPGGSRSSGLGIQQYSCNQTPSQSWTFTPSRDGYTRIKPGTNTGLCLDNNGSTTNGDQVMQVTCNPTSDSQKWEVSHNSDGTYTIAAHDGQGVLNISGSSGSDGAPLITWWYTAGATNAMFWLGGHP